MFCTTLEGTNSQEKTLAVRKNLNEGLVLSWISWLMLITAPGVGLIMVTNSYNLDRRRTAPEVRRVASLTFDSTLCPNTPVTPGARCHCGACTA